MNETGWLARATACAAVSTKAVSAVLVVPLVIAACNSSPIGQDADDVTVFTVTIDFKTGELDYDPTAFDGYGGGPVILRGVDGDGNVFHEESGENFGVALQGVLASIGTEDTEDVTVRRSP